MSSPSPNERPDAEYGRQLLLLGARRNAVLALWEIQRYGLDSYKDADYISIYGMRPVDWYAAGIRLLGRTAVECTRDVLADAIARDIAILGGSMPGASDALVIDPFAGSGNTLYWILEHLPGARGIGFELDRSVCEITKRNIAALSAPIEILNIDFAAGLNSLTVPADRLIVVFVAPPWGDALDPVTGLDLRRTSPPIADIVDLLVQRFPENRLLVAIQVFERLDPISLAELELRCDWSVLRRYELNLPGENHGVLLATFGWTPGPAPPWEGPSA